MPQTPQTVIRYSLLHDDPSIAKRYLRRDLEAETAVDDLDAPSSQSVKALISQTVASRDSIERDVLFGTNNCNTVWKYTTGQRFEFCITDCMSRHSPHYIRYSYFITKRSLKSSSKDDTPLARLVTHLLSKYAERDRKTKEEHYDPSQRAE